MRVRVILAVTVLALLWHSDGNCVATRKPAPSSKDAAAVERQRERIAKVRLIHDLVEIAMEKQRAGATDAAERILQAAVEIDPMNQEACSNLGLVQRAIQKKETFRDTLRPWYPTIPPRPARE